ncbi:DUF1365 domain-containing protein [Acinetobacter baumannii]|nr:DUF1365 domain-containing protein [Acinetobacter baumannii]
MLLNKLAIAPALIRHRRYSPKPHEFTSNLNYLWFDPDQLVDITKDCSLWSVNHWNVLKLFENDFLSMYYGSIREKVEKAILQNNHLHLRPDWQIRVLALPRCLGFRFNSVVFYFVLNKVGKPLFILSEITNTPWNERKVYTHDCIKQQGQAGDYQSFDFNFEKSFHVSPFMPMQLTYRWRFSFSDQQNVIHMQLFEEQKQVFDATMRFELEPITFPSQQYRYALMNSLAPFKMLFSIYLEAFKLWRKKVPFYRHPKKIKVDKT